MSPLMRDVDPASSSLVILSLMVDLGQGMGFRPPRQGILGSQTPESGLDWWRVRQRPDRPITLLVPVIPDAIGEQGPLQCGTHGTNSCPGLRMV